MEFGLENLMGQMPTNTSAVVQKINVPKDMRIIQVVGGYTINKHSNDFHPLEVCVTIEEVIAKINEFFKEKQETKTEIV